MSKSYILVDKKKKDTPEESAFRKLCEQMLTKMHKKSLIKEQEDLFRGMINDFLFERLKVKKKSNSFNELSSDQDFSYLISDLMGSEEPAPVKEEPTEELGDVSEPDFEGLDRSGVKAAEEVFKEIKKQMNNSYSDLANKKDRALFQNWLYINSLLLLHQTEASLVPPKGVEQTEPDEFMKTIDMTKVAGDLEIKTTSPGEEPGPNVEPAAFNRDEDGVVSAYDIIDQYISPAEDPDSTDETEEVRTQPTGINALGEFFKKVKDKIVSKYTILTSDPKQRSSFIESLMIMIKGEFDKLDASPEEE